MTIKGPAPKYKLRRPRYWADAQSRDSADIIGLEPKNYIETIFWAPTYFVGNPECWLIFAGEIRDLGFTETIDKSSTPEVKTFNMDNNSASYFPIGVQLLFALGFVGAVLGVTHLLGPKRKTAEKLQNFESGIESVGNARHPMAIKYFLVAILFVLFDVEVIFFYPYAVNFRGLGWDGFGEVLLFVGFFLAGFIYIIKKGALTWED